MFGIHSYISSVLLLTIPIILIQWLFFFHILKRHLLPITAGVIMGVVLVSVSDPLGVYLRVWEYGLHTTLPTTFLGVKIGSYVYVFMSAIAVGSMTIIYAYYEDKNIPNVFIKGLHDFINMKYALWKKDSIHK